MDGLLDYEVGFDKRNFLNPVCGGRVVNESAIPRNYMMPDTVKIGQVVRAMKERDEGGEGMRILRVFPRRTKATPTDDMVRVNVPPGLFDEADEVHISWTFSWDERRVERLARQWEAVAQVKIGGPANGDKGDAFTPGMYLKHGYTITSRGCPNRCWFCDVWKREGNIRELPIWDGWNVLDSNLLACSDDHVRAVFLMLSRQQERAEFTGGLEAARLKPWHCVSLQMLYPKQIFFAYDTPDDLEPLIEAGKMLRGYGFQIKHPLRAYVLCGYQNDTFEAAEKRLHQTADAGFLPMAMVYIPPSGKRNREWEAWKRQWIRPAIVSGLIKEAKV